jgi:glutamate-1-semialdehyde 2,1-aminomutase
MRNYEKSKLLYERACQSLAGGVSSEFRKFSYPHPLFYSNGNGSRIYDVDGNEYLDFSLSQGPLILGHSHPAVLRKIEEYSRNGQLFAGQHLLELELAEKLQQIIPCAELIRFSLSGSEANHAALRVARGVTGRPRFIRFEGHYHGWLDNVAMGINGASIDEMGDRQHPKASVWTGGLPDSVQGEFLLLPWNDLDLVRQTLEKNQSQIAAIIMEPIMCNSGCIPPVPGFLEGVRQLCDFHHVALIFDEVITGFRLSLGGAQTFYGVTPDLAVFGKAMASGYPISVLCGKREWMKVVSDGKVIHAGTMNGGNPTVAAASATIEMLEQPGVYERLYQFGEALMAGLCEAARETNNSVLVQGFGPVFHMGFTSQSQAKEYRDLLSYDRNKNAAFVNGMQEKGIRILNRGLWYISAAHTTEDIDQAILASYDVLSKMNETSIR